MLLSEVIRRCQAILDTNGDLQVVVNLTRNELGNGEPVGHIELEEVHRWKGYDGQPYGRWHKNYYPEIHDEDYETAVVVDISSD